MEFSPTPQINSIKSKDLEQDTEMFNLKTVWVKDFSIAFGLMAEVSLANKIKFVERKISFANRRELS